MGAQEAILAHAYVCPGGACCSCFLNFLMQTLFLPTLAYAARSLLTMIVVVQSPNGNHHLLFCCLRRRAVRRECMRWFSSRDAGQLMHSGPSSNGTGGGPGLKGFCQEQVPGDTIEAHQGMLAVEHGDFHPHPESFELQVPKGVGLVIDLFYPDRCCQLGQQTWRVRIVSFNAT